MASQYNSILTGTLNAVTALPNFTAFDSAIRARPYCSTQHGDTLPFVCISGTKERERELFFNGAWVEYPVYVVLFKEKGPAIEDSTARQWKYERREEIRHALWTPAAVLSTQIDCDYDPSPAWDFGGLEQHFDISVQLFTFVNEETR